MEPDGQSVTPGTNHGLPSISSAQDLFTPTFLNCSIGSLCSPNSGDNPVSAKWMWDVPGEEGLDQSEGSQPTTELPRGTQRKFKFSTFPTSLSWDSDSEKETLDEEELQNFSNPHGLAVHSPGSPSFGFRLDSEDDQECGKLHHFHCKTETNIAEGGHGGSNESTMAEEPNTSQLGQQELAESRMCTVSESAEPFLFNIKLKDGCQRKDEARNSKGEKRPKDKESNTSQWQNATSPSLAKHDGIEEDKGDAKKDLKVFCSRRSSRISAASVQTDSDDDEDDTTDEDEDVDEEHTACFLPDDFLDEDIDEIDDDSEVLKSIERKCPYCPDRFHNGIGLANHVRGHLNRVGVSYNVRHFISPEEVNEIEKKFFYQKKKKKAALQGVSASLPPQRQSEGTTRLAVAAHESRCNVPFKLRV